MTPCQVPSGKCDLDCDNCDLDCDNNSHGHMANESQGDLNAWHGIHSHLIVCTLKEGGGAYLQQLLHSLRKAVQVIGWAGQGVCVICRQAVGPSASLAEPVGGALLHSGPRDQCQAGGLTEAVESGGAVLSIGTSRQAWAGPHLRALVAWSGPAHELQARPRPPPPAHIPSNLGQAWGSFRPTLSHARAMQES
jgi:hypothetical protein